MARLILHGISILVIGCVTTHLLLAKEKPLSPIDAAAGVPDGKETRIEATIGTSGIFKSKSGHYVFLTDAEKYGETEYLIVVIPAESFKKFGDAEPYKLRSRFTDKKIRVRGVVQKEIMKVRSDKGAFVVEWVRVRIEVTDPKQIEILKE